MATANCQVVIHIIDRPLKFSSKNALIDYIDAQRMQGGTDETGQPIWKKFEHLPLLKIIDDREGMGGYEIVFITKEEIPSLSIYNDKGIPLINFT
jgi:hypothetical protein